MEYT